MPISNKKVKRVKIADRNTLVADMFRRHGGYSIVENDFETPDLICFTGGADVNPKFYGESSIPETQYNLLRDESDIKVWKKFPKVPKIGICRGGQFLNVMNGGKMWQHVTNHGVANGHKLINLLPGLKDYELFDEVMVTSTHHQMMIPNEEKSETIGVAMGKGLNGGISDVYKAGPGVKREKPEWDTEVVWYPESLSLCFQPHPEYNNHSELNDCRKYFFTLIDYFFWDNPDKNK